MFKIPVKDLRDIYARLIEIARLRKDEGDVDGRPPSTISPADIVMWGAKRRNEGLPGIKIDGRSLNIFEVVELYRQLVYYDRIGKTKLFHKGVEDCVLERDTDESRKTKDKNLYVHVPNIPEGYQYWGKDWTPQVRLTVFINFYSEFLMEMSKKVDPNFPRAEAYVNGLRQKVDDIRPVDEKEMKFIEEFAKEIENRNGGKYSKHLIESIPKIRILEILVPAEHVGEAAYESKVYGYTHLFTTDGEPAIYFPIYRQFGQKYFYDERNCKRLRNINKEEFPACMPLVGLNDRNEALDQHIRLYEEGKYFTRGDQEYKWGRMDTYLHKRRVYNYFRYDVNIPAKLFSKMLILHESLHERNAESSENVEEHLKIKSPPAVLIETMIESFKNITDPYERYHAGGAMCVYLQRFALEGKETVKSEKNKVCRELRKKPDDRELMEKCDRLDTELNFFEMLNKLAAEAEERMVEDEVYEVVFGSNIPEIKYVKDERDLIQNPNEMKYMRIKYNQWLKRQKENGK